MLGAEVDRTCRKGEQVSGWEAREKEENDGLRAGRGEGRETLAPLHERSSSLMTV